MANIELFCLIRGDATEHVFRVEIARSKPVASLKKLIEQENPNRFKNIDVSNLTLWGVSVPLDENADIMLRQLVFEDNEPKGIRKLLPANSLSTYFSDKLADRHVHIIADPPIAPKAAPQAPHVSPKIILPDDHIDETLTNIINKQNYKLHKMDMGEVENFQKNLLGRFYRPLPPGKIETHVNLVMLGHVLPDMEPTTGPNHGTKRTFSEIVKEDIKIMTGKRTVAIVARSGSGKTATVIHLAKEHFVIYVVCESPYSRTPDFNDTNFRRLAKEVEGLSYCLQAPFQVGDDTQKYMDDIRKYDSQLKLLASERVELEFLARQLFLKLLFRKYPQITPEEFFREQINKGSITIGKLVGNLREYDPQTIHNMLIHVGNDLQTFLNGRALVIALDEAHIAETDIMHDKLILPWAITHKVNFLERNGTIRSDLRRGFLTPLCATLSEMCATLVVLGTSLTLMYANHVYSAISKPDDRFAKVTSFPSCDELQVELLLGKIIDISDCEIPPEKKRRLRGRFRFTTSIVNEITKGVHDDSQSKQEILDEAIDSSIKNLKNQIRSNVHKLLLSDKAGMIKHLFSRMVIADKLKSGKVAFAQLEKFDFVNYALCALRKDNDDYHWVTDEPIVVEVMEEELKWSGADHDYLEYLEQFNPILTNLGATSSTRVQPFELLVYRSLKRFNGYLLKDLPFLKDIENLPEWCKNTTLNVTKVGTAIELGYDNDNMQSDLEYLKESPPGQLLIPTNVTRPDGVSFFDHQYGLTLAIKLYSTPFSKDVHLSNKRSSDLRQCFIKGDGEPNPALGRIRKQFEGSGILKRLKGVLRIHLEFPRVQGGTPKSYVDGEDVLVYIDISNMDTFFDENIGDHPENIRTLKNMIRYIQRAKCNCKSGCTNKCPCFMDGYKCYSSCKCTQCHNQMK